MKIDELLASATFIKALIKGPPGSGKTFVAASASRVFKPTLFIDAEGGLLSARHVLDGSSIEIEQVRSPSLPQFFDRLGEAMGEATSGKYKCVVVDSISEIAGRMEDQYATQIEDDRSRGKAWFTLTERIKRFSRMLRDIPCHTILTALTKPTGKEDGENIFECALPGQTSVIVPSFFDIVGMTRKIRDGKGYAYVFSSSGPAIFQVRDRTNILAADELLPVKNPEEVWKKLAAGIITLSTTPVNGGPK